MDASPPNLLTLPRELRDRIYSHLTHQIDLSWDYSDISTLIGADGDTQLIEPVHVRVLNYPIPQVLCVHPRIYEEYHAACLNNLEAVINPALYTLEDSRVSPHYMSKDFTGAVLARLRHVTIFETLHAKTTSNNLDWQDHLNLLGALTKTASKLVTVRVALRQQYHANSPTFDEVQMPSVLIPAATRLANATSHPFLPAMPPTLNAMPLLQRGEGYHIGYAPTSLSPRSPFPQPTTHTHTINGRMYSLSHAIRKIGIYMYSREDSNFSKRMWNVKEVVERWPIRRYPKEAIESVERERGKVFARSPWEFGEWVERRGGETVKRWEGAL
jgi:hypothetical protein